MSSPIWTRDALASERRAWAGDCWRLVEAQHRVSTLKLTDSNAEQALLEKLLDDTKPALPPEAQGLHYLMASPFRYGAIYPHGSRFRRAGRTPGVFYGAEQPQTAVAEMAFYRLLFFAESPATPWPSNAAEYSAFCVAVKTEAALDLTRAPFAAHRASWTSLTDYEACQSFAETGRDAEAQIIRYESVRDPKRRANLALLTPRAFARRAPKKFETWRIRLSRFGVQALREFPAEAHEFGRDAFASDPRLKEMRWERGS